MVETTREGPLPPRRQRDILMEFGCDASMTANPRDIAMACEILTLRAAIGNEHAAYCNGWNKAMDAAAAKAVLSCAVGEEIRSLRIPE